MNQFKFKRWVIFVASIITILSVAIVSAQSTHTIFLPVIQNNSGGNYIGPSDLDGYVFVPAGEFIMGSNESIYENPLLEIQQPAHTVYLDEYYIGKTEVTNSQYEACVMAGDCTVPNNDTAYGNPTYANHPVVQVNWYQAQAYCEWDGGSLPTEAQWEKAARGTDERTYPWGEEIDETYLNHTLNIYDTTAVGSYPKGASPYGALDMAGNVGEWTADWIDEDYYKISPVNNPMGPAEPVEDGTRKVFRGGDWYFTEFSATTFFRNAYGAEFGLGTLGFRCASTPVTQ